MDTTLDRAARRELADVIRSRYQSASGTDKRKILDEFVAITGYHEKSAIRVLNAMPTIKGPTKRSRAPLYDEAVRAALVVLWEASDRVCGKRLQPLLPILLPALERNGHLNLQAPSALRDGESWELRAQPGPYRYRFGVDRVRTAGRARRRTRGRNGGTHSAWFALSPARTGRRQRQ